MDSIDALNRKVKEAYFASISKLPTSAMNATKKGFKAIKGVAGVAEAISLPGIASVIPKGVSSVLSVNFFDFVTVKNTVGKNKCFVLIFDDVERSQIDIVNLFGAINEYSENVGIKVILAANDEEIKESEVEEYRRYKEKLVGRTLRLDADYQRIIASFVDHYQETAEGYRSFLQTNVSILQDVFFESNTNNLRTAKVVITEFERIYEIWKGINIPTELQEKILYNYCAICFENSAGTYDDKYEFKLFKKALEDNKKDHDEEKIKKYDEQYSRWEREYQPESIRKWITTGEWNEEKIKADFGRYGITETISPEKMLLYGAIYNLTQDECEARLKDLINKAYVGELKCGEYALLLNLMSFLQQGKIDVNFEIDYEQVEAGLDMRIAYIKLHPNDSEWEYACPLSSEQLNLLGVGARTVYDKFRNAYDHKMVWEIRKQFIDYLIESYPANTPRNYISSFDSELIEPFMRRYQQETSIERHSLIILLRNMLQYPNLDEQTTSERKETIDSLGIICEGINAISDTSEDEIEKYYHRKNVELLNAIIEQWKERLKAFG